MTKKFIGYSKEEFKERVQEYANRALYEFYRGRLARKNRKSQLAKYFEYESYCALRNLSNTILEFIHGFRSRRTPYNKIVADMKKIDNAYRIAAAKVLAENYKVKIKYQVTDDDSKEFFDQLQHEAEISLDAMEYVEI